MASNEARPGGYRGFGSHVEHTTEQSRRGKQGSQSGPRECRACLDRFPVDDLDDCLGCGAVDLCIDCMARHDCEGVAIGVARAQDRQKYCII